MSSTKEIELSKVNHNIVNLKISAYISSVHNYTFNYDKIGAGSSFASPSTYFQMNQNRIIRFQSIKHETKQNFYLFFPLNKDTT